MIVAVAGHVDHGKTSLVRALTGVETDRLAEEKRRGMSIDLGFAYAEDGGTVTGFVDVPGHERFVRNMLAGLAGIDMALLVVAADDGPMPQTREHLAILGLLGVPRLAVALTKADRVAPDRLAAAEAEVAALLASGPHAAAPVFPVATPEGKGLPLLRAHLSERAALHDPPEPRGLFRMPVDRAFTLPGAGLVVTGAIVAGAAAPGDRLVLSPAGIEVRVRSVHALNRPAEAARKGERAALNLIGPALGRAEIGRGDWLVAPDLHAPATQIDVRLRMLPGEAKPLRDGARVFFHHGAAAVPARVGVLGGQTIVAGEDGLARIVPDRPLPALGGDRFVLRDAGATRTLGGGQILDPFGPARGRARPGRLAELSALEAPDDDLALAALLDLAADGVDIGRFALQRNLAPAERAALAAARGGRSVVCGGRSLLFSDAAWTSLSEAIPATLEALHQAEPDLAALHERRVASALPRPAPPDLLRACAMALAAEGRIVRDGAGLRLPGHAPRATEADEDLWRRVAPLFEATAPRPPVMGEVSEMLGIPVPDLSAGLLRLARLGRIVALGGNRFILPAAARDLARIAERLADAAGGEIDTAAFRDLSGIGRNHTVRVLEHLDAIGLTRRTRTGRRLAARVADLFGESGSAC